jgi:uncharacterized protein YnzC (UPF0291/DUF896 family)
MSEEIAPYIHRINELARKAKSIGLTDTEIEERNELRKQYIQAVTGNFRNQLDNIKFVDDQGNEVDIKGDGKS